MDFRIISAIILWILLATVAVAPMLRAGRENRTLSTVDLYVYLFLFAVALPIWRLRSLLYDGEINVDESQFLSQVLRYKIDPIPWRSVDGGSSGPLNTWILMWAPFLGFKVDYFAARVTSLLCIWATVSGLVFTLLEVAGRRFALLLVMPASTFYLASVNFDYVFYSSELLPSAIFSWVFFFTVKQLNDPSKKNAFIVGVLCGALPFCKIQAGPSAVYICMVVAGGTVWLFRWTKDTLQLLLAQMCGGLLIPSLILTPVFFSGAWSDFTDLYIRTALQYKSSEVSRHGKGFVEFLRLLTGAQELLALEMVLIGITIASLGYCILRFKKYSSKGWGTPVLLFGFTIVTIQSIYRTGFLFPHYTLFLVVPFTLWCASVVANAFGVKDISSRSRKIIGVGIIALVLAVQGWAAIQEFKRSPQLLMDWGRGVHPIGEILRKLVVPGDTMVVWGYAPKYHVFSGIAPATRNSTTTGLMVDNRDYSRVSEAHLERFVSDLVKYKPALFIDSPDEFWFPDASIPRGTIARHFSQQKVASFVAAEYELVGQYNLPAGKVPALVYKRRQAQ